MDYNNEPGWIKLTKEEFDILMELIKERKAKKLTDKIKKAE